MRHSVIPTCRWIILHPIRRKAASKKKHLHTVMAIKRSALRKDFEAITDINELKDVCEDQQQRIEELQEELKRLKRQKKSTESPPSQPTATATATAAVIRKSIASQISSIMVYKPSLKVPHAWHT